jgi:DNA-binding transcriptional MocR family regulator
MIRRSVSGARYQRIATVFRDRIHSGELPPGTRLPAETEVAQEYGVSRKLVVLTPGQEAHLRPPTPAEREEGDLHPKIPLLIVVDPDGTETHYSADVVRIRPWEAPS